MLECYQSASRTKCFKKHSGRLHQGVDSVSSWTEHRRAVREAREKAADSVHKTRRNKNVEHVLQAEHIVRCRALGILAVPIPNEIILINATTEQRKLIAKITQIMINMGLLYEGASDLVLANTRGYGFLELKKPETWDLFRVSPAGKPTAKQLRFEKDCHRCGVNHGYSTSWEETLAHMRRWRMID